MKELAERRADAIVAIMRCSESALTAVEVALARHRRVDLGSPGNQGADMSQDEQASGSRGSARGASQSREVVRIAREQRMIIQSAGLALPDELITFAGGTPK